jgi:outer membrane protein insertion porin family
MQFFQEFNKMMKFIFIFLFLLINNSYADINKIDISGNLRVSSSTIENLVNKKTKNVDSIYINNLTKKIYDTEFFSDVKISYNQEILKIIVVENPVVNFFYINGLEGDDLTEVNKIITLKENVIFSNSKLKNDLEKISSFLKTRGYFQSIVSPDVIKIENTQINLIYNIDKKEISKIEKIYFIGQKFFNDSTLIDVISSTEDSWWKILTSSPFTEERVEFDKSLLKEFYKSKGFYDAQIESAYATINNNNNFSLTFVINSGNKYNFSQSDIKVNSTSFKENDILELKKIANNNLKNKIYSPKTVSKLYQNLTEYLESKKYSNFDVKIDELKANEKNINLVIQLNDTKKFLINRIDIKGNNVTEERVIRNQIKLSEGDYFESFNLKKTIENIKSSGLFKDITYKIENTDKIDQKNLEFSVKEQPTGSISAGAGYGSNGALIQTSINEKNFLGKGINLNAAITASQERVNGEITYIEPNFNNSNRDLIFALYSERNEYDNGSYTNSRIGTKLGTRYEVYDEIYFRPSIALQYDDLTTTSSASSLLRNRQGDYTTTLLGYNFFIDKRDSKNKPTSGFTTIFEQNLSTPFLSDIPALETVLGVTFFKEIIEDKSLGTAKLKLANSSALDSKYVKLSDRQHASNVDIKGFESRGIGPVDGVDHVGGNNLATLSFKSTFPNPIPDSLRANTFIFYDVGSVWGVDYSDTISSNSKIRSSIGLGLDINSPLGPVSFVYGVPISKSSTDIVQKFTFNIGTSF